VDQKNVGNMLALTAGTGVIDRWYVSVTGTFRVSAGKQAAVWTSPIVVPGTNFVISNNYLRTQLTTTQASLGATDNLNIFQQVEGPLFRELSFDVHSISLLVRSSVAGLNFGVNLRDQATGRSLSKLCTIPSANTWTLITLPNLPTWPSAGTFGITPGTLGYYLAVTLACGSTYMSSANDIWLASGNLLGAVGQSNFAASPVNSTFDIAFCQHEPGGVCSTLMDKTWDQNYSECLRYYAKSYEHGTAPGTAASVLPMLTTAAGVTTQAVGTVSFPKPLAKAPTVTCYAASGAANSGTIFGASTIGITASASSSKHINAVTIASAQTAGTGIQFHYTADTGW
jgi:hypothetical protein